jgi:hypothetical protein
VVRCVGFVLFVLSIPLHAQTIPATGRVVNADSLPVRGVRAVLHRVGAAIQGPVDSTRSDRQGGFRFNFRPDTGAFYLVSARYAGIEYFSSPLATNPAKPDTGLRIVVYDTSSTAPVALEARHLVVTRPGGETGARSVLDLLVLRNDGTRTRVAPDTLLGSWSTSLPRGTVGLELSEGDMSAAAVTRAGDSLVLASALAPGEKQLTLQYEIPANQQVIELPVRRGLSLNVLAEEPAVRVSAPGISSVDTQVIQGRVFQRWTGAVASNGVLRVTVPGLLRPPPWLLPGLIALLALGLLGTGWYGIGKRVSTASSGIASELAQTIAALDAQFLERRQEMPDDQWAAYLTERARLKRQLESALAGDGEKP